MTPVHNCYLYTTNMNDPRINLKPVAATRHVSIWFDEALSLFIHRWTNHNQTMGVYFEVFIENAAIVAKHQVRLRPKSVIVDTLDLNITFGGDDIQRRVSFHIENAMHGAGSEHLAFIKSKDTFTQISIEQLLQEARNPQFQVRFFDTEKRALDWLMV